MNLVFDMDGTLLDFYGVDGWLEDLQNQNTRPYEIAKPFYDMDMLNEVLTTLKNQGHKIIIVSWLAKNSTQEYKNRVRKAKRDWLKKYAFPYDEIHLVQYGTPKHYIAKGILFDDDQNVRNAWQGMTVNANKNILKVLQGLV